MSKVINDLLVVLGVIFTIIGAIASVVAVLPDSWKKGSLVEQSQVGVASAIAPSGFTVSQRVVPRVSKNSKFSLAVHESLLLETSSGTDTISLVNTFGIHIILVLNGVSNNVWIGDHIKTSDDGCFVWPISGANWRYKWEFEYHCDKK